MFAALHFTATTYGSGAVLAWGTSDFLGGYFTRRTDAFLFTAIFNLGALIVIGTLAAASHSAIPSGLSALWVLAGGVSGGLGVAIFFRALSTGKMGLTAPVAAVLGAAIPACVSMFSEGFAGNGALVGFLLAGVGLWLITRSEDGNSPKGIGLAALAGVGFAGFFLGARQGGQASPLWIATLTRAGGLLITGLIVFLRPESRDITRGGALRAVMTGCIDTLGTILFVCASQSGRLDKAVVLSSLYPAVTVILAHFVLKEHFTRWKIVGLLAALAAVPLIAAH
jgi:drug/metabolite transporter (DMT)-like permease